MRARRYALAVRVSPRTRRGNRTILATGAQRLGSGVRPWCQVTRPELDDRLAACRRGERDAQRALYVAFADLVFGTASRYARGRQEAEDFSQEAWLTAFAKLDRYSGAGSFAGWLRRVTANVCVSQLRRRGLTLSASPGLALDAAHVDPAALDNLSTAEIVAAISHLPEGYRVVFNLVAVEGYSHAEAADILGIAPSASRSQLTRARAALQRRLAKSHTLCS